MPATNPENAANLPVRAGLITPPTHGTKPKNPIFRHVNPKVPTYGNDPDLKQRIARHQRRKKARKANYYGRSFSGEFYILKAMAVLHRQLLIERTANKGLSFRNLLFLLLAKQYMTSYTLDSFYASAIGNYTNAILGKHYSFRTSLCHALVLERLGYINPLTNDTKVHHTPYVLSMKSRALFRDLEREFKRDYDVMSYIHTVSE